MMNEPQHQRPVTLEDLLQLKRAERPSPEFWTKFESQLRAKQLAAILEKRPWWRRVSFAGVMRHRLTLGVTVGTTAILAITVLSVREFRSSGSSTPRPLHAVEDAVAAASIAPDSQEASSDVIAAHPEPGSVVAESSALPAMGVASSLVEVPRQVAYASESTDIAGGVGTVAVAATDDQSAQWSMTVARAEKGDLTPMARSIADNLAAAKEAHPELTNRFFGVSGFEKRSMPASRTTVDPLAQVRGPSEVNLRVLVASARSTVSLNPARDGDRIARRISDERLTEEAISRFGAKADRFLVKF